MNPRTPRTNSASEAAATKDSTSDPWLRSFLRPDAPDVFHAVVHTLEIHRSDPLDIPTIHADARDVFTQLVSRARDPARRSSGRTLLVLGEAGAGKTHLMRAFRNEVHRRQAGYVAYLQMTSTLEDYPRFLLGHVIESLSQPFDLDQGERTALQRLSDHLVDSPQIVPPDLIKAIGNESHPEKLRKHVNKVVNSLVRAERELVGVDSEVLPALVYLQSQDPSIRRHVTPVLRCQDLSVTAREALGGIQPMVAPDDPLRALTHLGKLMSMANDAAFVILVDQLETSAAELDRAEVLFRRAMQTLCDIVDRIPNAVIVVSCLRDFWSQFEPRLAKSLLDRLLYDPVPVQLVAQRTPEEAVDLVAVRLEHLLDADDLEPKPADRTYPFDAEDLRSSLGGKTSREIIEGCRQARDRALLSGKLPRLALEPASTASSFTEAPSQPVVTIESLEREWADFFSQYAEPTPTLEEELADLLKQAIELGTPHLATQDRFEVTTADNRVHVRITSPDGGRREFHAVICDRSARGGGLSAQLDQAARKVGDDRVAILRTVGFIFGRATAISQKLADLLGRGWIQVSIEETEWRALAAFLAFRSLHQNHPEWSQWVCKTSPIASGRAMIRLLDRKWMGPAVAPTASARSFASATSAANAAASPLTSAIELPQDPTKAIPSGGPPALPPGVIELGLTMDLHQRPMTMDLGTLTRHGAIVGGSGSGKTTLAMHFIEQALLQGVPVLVMDRKGDLASWARPDAMAPRGEDRDATRRRFAKSVDVRLYTPGDPRGRDLSLPVLPCVDSDAASADVDDACEAATSALAAMLGYAGRGATASRRAVLGRAITLLCDAHRGRRLSLDDLVAFIGNQDPTLITAIGQLDEKTLQKTAGDLQTLVLNNRRLLASDAPELSGAQLLGTESSDGRTALTIISGVGLGGEEGLLFFVSRLFATLSAYAARTPSTQLQALVLLDEADRYLPAQSSPASKPEIENALRRWRSAGIGLLLSSQGPGDFDYRCRDNIASWFVGLVKEKRAHEKLKPLFQSSKLAPEDQLPKLKAGEFLHVTGSEAVKFKGHLSLTPSAQLPEAEIRILASRRSSP